MIKKIDKDDARMSRKKRVRSKISGTPDRPRLNVYRSLNHIYVQIIDDVNGKTLVSCSTLDKEVVEKIAGKNKTEQAKVVGEIVAKKAIKAKIKEVVFDRAGYLYTGRIAAVAEGARAAGLVL